MQKGKGETGANCRVKLREGDKKQNGGKRSKKGPEREYTTRLGIHLIGKGF